MFDLTKTVKVNGVDWGVPKVNVKHPLAPNSWVFDNGRTLSYFDGINHWECNKMESVFTVEQNGRKIFDRKTNTAVILCK